MQTSFAYTYLAEVVIDFVGGRYDDFVIFCIQVTEYLLDHQWVFDARYNLNRTNALLKGCLQRVMTMLIQSR